MAKKRINLDDMSKDELLELNKRVVNKIRELGAEKTRQFVVGDKVKFKRRSGRLVKGKVEKVNRKTVDVYSSDERCKYRVSGGLLERA